MVGGGVRERNKNRGNATRRDLGQRRRPGTGNYQVGSSKGFTHMVLISHSKVTLPLFIGKRKRFGYRIKLFRAGDVHHVYIVHCQKLILHGNKGRIDVARAQTATKHQKHCGILRDPEIIATLFTRCLKHRRAHGIAGNQNLRLIFNAMTGSLIGQADGSSIL